jgi:hypothetical protein
MDADELSTPGYTILSPATRTKLATLDKGQLMVRHPHFTQPVFVRFPRPAVMRGRDGVDQYPQALALGLEEAVLRSLRTLDPSLTIQWVQETVGIHDESAVIRARNATLRERPPDVRSFFKSQFRGMVPPRPVQRRAPTPIKSAPVDDPYGF